MVPKLLTSPCTMRMPKFITDCCRQVKPDRLSSWRRVALFQTRSSRRTRRAKAFQVYPASPRPARYWEITVARAAPAPPSGEAPQRGGPGRCSAPPRFPGRAGVTGCPPPGGGWQKVIEKGGHNPGKDPQQVGLGEACDLRGNLQQEEDGVHHGVDQGVEHQGDGANEEKRPGRCRCAACPGPGGQIGWRSRRWCPCTAPRRMEVRKVIKV